MLVVEKRDLYDLNRNLTGEVINKGQRYSIDRKILVVLLWIENSKGEILIQKRCENNKWAATCGHPKSGESSIEGIITEVKEELGIDISNEDIKLINSNYDELVFVDVYYLKKDLDIDKLNIQKEELKDVKWVSLDKIKKLIEQNNFFEKHIDKYQMLLEYKTLSY